MPFLSLLSNPGSSFGTTGRAKYGASAGRQYSFVPSPFGGYFNQVNTIPAVPATMGEYYQGSDNNSTFNFYVNAINAGVRNLYWTIKHGTTTAADFYENSGVFTSNNWGNTFATSLSPQYAHGYGEELGRFPLNVAEDFTTEGAETFQVQIRENSISGPVVLTSSVITINDTSRSPEFSFNNSWNNFYLQTGFNERQGYELRVLANNIPVTGNTYIYYTFTGIGGNAIDMWSWADDIYQQRLPTGQMYIYNNQYWNGSEFVNLTTGWGRFFIVPQGDYLTEGPETFQIQLRLNSITGPVVATTPVYTINDTTTR